LSNWNPLLLGKRVFVYCLGLFVMALGVSLSVLSDLGVSPMSSIPYVLSEIIPSISMGTFTTALFCSYILVQAILLGRRFQAIRLLQILCSFLFGWFVDLTNWLVGLFLPQPEHYLVRLIWLVIGMACVGLGIFLYISPKMQPLPGEGVMQVISEKYHIPLHWAKIGFDVTVTVIALALSLGFFHTLHGVREGTVLAALGVGKFLGLFVRLFQQRLDRFLQVGPASGSPDLELEESVEEFEETFEENLARPVDNSAKGKYNN
jgi:hypothetical protein